MVPRFVYDFRMEVPQGVYSWLPDTPSLFSLLPGLIPFPPLPDFIKVKPGLLCPFIGANLYGVSIGCPLIDLPYNCLPEGANLFLTLLSCT